MSIKGLLFDKDGTLIDFNRTWLPAYQEAAAVIAASYNQPALAHDLLVSGGYIPETCRWQPDSVLASGSNQQILAHWQDQLGAAIDGLLEKQLRSIFSARNLDYAGVIQDMRGFMQGLRNNGYYLGVATMDDEAHALDTLAHMQILDLIDFTCGADSGFGVKPEAGMVLAFCDHCRLKPESVAMIGDSPRDLLMAGNARTAHAIGVLTGASSAEALEPHADIILDSIAELPDYLKEVTTQ